MRIAPTSTLQPTSLIAVAVTVLVLALLSVAIAQAQTGLTIAPGRVEADQPLTPGETYDLPVYSVNNGGSEALRVTAGVSDHTSGERLLPPAEWFTVEPASVDVPAGESGSVQATVILPADAAPGDYTVWFAFAGTPMDAQGISSGAAVQVPFVFTVQQRVDDGSRFVPPIWTWGVFGVVIGGGTVFILSAYSKNRSRRSV